MAAASAPSAFAQTRYWGANAAGTTYIWSDTANWIGGNVADVTGETVSFGGNNTVGNTTQQNAGGNITITQDLASITINGLNITTGGSNGSATLTLNGNAITFVGSTLSTATAGTVINRGANFANNVIINNDLVLNGNGAIAGFANMTINGNISGSGILIANAATGVTYNGRLSTAGLVFRGGTGGQFQPGNFRAGNVNVFTDFTGPITWLGGVNATSTSGGVLSLLWNTGTGTISSALDFGVTDTNDMLAIQQVRGGTVEFTTNSITNGTGNRSLRLVSGTTGSGQGTIRFSGSGFDVTRDIEFGGSTTAAGNATSANSANVRLEFANTSGVQRFSGNFTNPSASTGTISILRSGAGGTTVLSGTQSVVAAIDVTGGTLILNGNGSANTGAVTVGVNGTLGGIGRIGGATTVSGVLSAGDSTVGDGVGLLSFSSSLVLNTGSTSNFSVNGAGRGTGYDAVNVTGALTYGGTLAVNFGTTFGDGTYSFDLFDFGSQSGTFGSVSIAGSYTAALNAGNSYTFTDGTNTWTFDHTTGTLGLVVSAIPEPSAVAVLAGALVLGCAAYRRRRHS